jgi:hypothetical protein
MDIFIFASTYLAGIVGDIAYIAKLADILVMVLLVNCIFRDSISNVI